MTAKPIRVLLADDHPVFREGMRTVLQGCAEIDVIAEAENGTEVARLALELEPDVVVMDLAMPQLSGIQATRQILDHSPDIRVLVITMSADDDSIFSATRAGASGYLLKGAKPNEIVRTVIAVAGGEAVFGPGIARRVLGYFGTMPRRGSGTVFPELTQREIEVLELLATGIPNRVIAQDLFVNEKTIRNHVSNIFSKLHVADRAEAIVRARQAGLGDR